MSIASIAGAALKNVSAVPQSVAAGGAASFIIFVAGAVLVAAGVAIPGLGPITMTMVGIASPVIGHIVTMLVPDSDKQVVNALADKLKTSIDNIKLITPDVELSFPTDKNGKTLIATKVGDNKYVVTHNFVVGMHTPVDSVTQLDQVQQIDPNAPQDPSQPIS